MWIKRRIAKFQKGASLTEMVVVSPVLLLFGLSTVQAGLIYHGKTTINYATFEAARSGAVNHGQVSVMRNELGLRLAPLEGGDGSTERAASAIAHSVLKAENPVNTRVKIISPSIEAFEDWKITDDEGREVIPNSHLRHIHGEMAGAGTDCQSPGKYSDGGVGSSQRYVLCAEHVTDKICRHSKNAI